jgi:hypothetical protein
MEFNRFSLLIAVSFGLWSSPLCAVEKFEPGCKLPFEDIKGMEPDGDPLSIDEKCGVQGDPTAKEPHRLQNSIKNNFCASGSPATVTLTTFKKLQKAADDEDVPHGSTNLPDDRSVLKNLITTSSGDKVGEGTKVRFAAVILAAHYSNVSKGESVNCKKKGQQYNDIHIVLANNANAEPCDTVAAEISPHFRPPAWLPDNLDRIRRPIRVTGQLFFDASHEPCRPGKRASPARVSVWEIHPIYAIDVCTKKTLQSCKAARESDWVPLHEWFALEEDHGDE